MLSMRFDRRLFAAPVIVAATFSLLYFGRAAPGLIRAPLLGNAYVDALVKYQLLTLVLAGLVLLLTYALGPQSFRRFFRLGRLDAPAGAVKWLGISAKDTWGSVGRSFALIVSLATAAFIYINVARGQSLQAGSALYLPWVLVLAASNAFVEEAITRLSLVSALDSVLARPYIYLASALVFGIPHYFGVPGGVSLHQNDRKHKRKAKENYFQHELR